MNYIEDQKINGILESLETQTGGTKKEHVREIIFKENKKFLQNIVEKLFEQVELNSEERNAICEPGNAAIRGRSGTGKTTCLIMNILLHMLRGVDFSKIPSAS